MKDSGYNLFNESDSFYTDICSTYTSQNGTDMTLGDRKQEIFLNKGNINTCQDSCEFVDYYSSIQKAKCECSPQMGEIDINSEFSDNKFTIKNIENTFYETLNNSNFRTLKCYELAFDFHDFFKNIGRIIMSVIIILHFIVLNVFLFYDFKNIKRFFINIYNFKRNINIKECQKKKGKKNNNKNKEKKRKKVNKKIRIKKKEKRKKKNKEDENEKNDNKNNNKTKEYNPPKRTEVHSYNNNAIQDL